MTIQRLDARGLVCPLPVLKAQRLLKVLPPGDILKIAATDPNAKKDFPSFCTESGYVFVGIRDDEEGYFEITVKVP